MKFKKQIKVIAELCWLFEHSQTFPRAGLHLVRRGKCGPFIPELWLHIHRAEGYTVKDDPWASPGGGVKSTWKEPTVLGTGGPGRARIGPSGSPRGGGVAD